MYQPYVLYFKSIDASHYCHRY